MSAIRSNKPCPRFNARPRIWPWNLSSSFQVENSVVADNVYFSLLHTKVCKPERLRQSVDHCYRRCPIMLRVLNQGSMSPGKSNARAILSNIISSITFPSAKETFNNWSLATVLNFDAFCAGLRFYGGGNGRRRMAFVAHSIADAWRRLRVVGTVFG